MDLDSIPISLHPSTTGLNKSLVVVVHFRSQMHHPKVSQLVTGTIVSTTRGPVLLQFAGMWRETLLMVPAGVRMGEFNQSLSKLESMDVNGRYIMIYPSERCIITKHESYFFGSQNPDGILELFP